MSSFMQQFVEFFSNPQIKRESPATRGAKCGPPVFCTKKNEDSILFRSSFVFFFSHSSAWRIMKGNVMAGTCTVWPRSPFTFLIRWRLRHQNNGIRRSRTITTRFFAPHSLFRQMIFFSEMVEKRLLPWCYLRLFFNQLEGGKKKLSRSKQQQQRNCFPWRIFFFNETRLCQFVSRKINKEKESSWREGGKTMMEHW